MNTNELCNPEEFKAGFSAHESRNGIIVMRKNKQGKYEIFEDLVEVSYGELHEMLADYLDDYD